VIVSMGPEQVRWDRQKNPDFLEQNVGKNAHAERFAELSTRLTAVAASTNLSAPFHN